MNEPYGAMHNGQKNMNGNVFYENGKNMTGDKEHGSRSRDKI